MFARGVRVRIVIESGSLESHESSPATTAGILNIILCVPI